jgi:hypothetical protein
MQHENNTVNQKSPATAASTGASRGASRPGDAGLAMDRSSGPLRHGVAVMGHAQQMNEMRWELASNRGSRATSKQIEAIAAQSREDVKQALAKVSVLENKLAESQNQQIALEALYQELSKSRDEISLSEVEDTLVNVSQQLQLAGNIKAALIGLQSVDTRLTRVDKPKWTNLRRAIAQDMAKLKALPYVDTVGMSARLNSLIGGVDALPLISAPVDFNQYSEVLRTRPAPEPLAALRRGTMGQPERAGPHSRPRQSRTALAITDPGIFSTPKSAPASVVRPPRAPGPRRIKLRRRSEGRARVAGRLLRFQGEAGTQCSRQPAPIGRKPAQHRRA